MTSKPKRNAISLSTKLSIIKDREDGQTPTAIMEKYSIKTMSTVTSIYGNREKIKLKSELNQVSGKVSFQLTTMYDN